ncbi:hypothetical protein ABPG77_008069 [Micractinium sp. CCAP 211/92]
MSSTFQTQGAEEVGCRALAGALRRSNMAQVPCVVGVALKRAKRHKHFNQKLLEMAAQNGIELRFVDKDVPLEEQGPFAAILQKVRKPDWEQMLMEYATAHPEVQIFDMPEATYPLRNRGTMVSFLDGDGWVFEEPAELVEPGRAPQRCRCNVPTNTTLAEGTGLEAALAQMAAAGLRFPVLAKPLWADGREGSHALAVVHTPRGLERLVAGQAAYLQLPVMLQQYVDHGGCLFKVYVLGDTSVRVKRNSLHLAQCSARASGACTGQAANARQEHGQQHQQRQQHQQAGGARQQARRAAAAPGHEGAGQAAAAPGGAPPEALADQQRAQQGAAQQAVQQQQQQQQHQRWATGGLPDLELMERVSAYPASKSWGRADTAPKGHGVPSPPAWLLQALAQRLRRKTGLSLFNFDVIVPMHCHRRLTHQHSVSPHGTGSGAAGGAGTPNGGSPPPAPPNSIAAAAAAALAAVQADAPAAAACEQSALDDEPAVLNLTAASAASVAAAAAGARVEGHGGGGVAAGSSARHRQQQAQQGPGQQELLYHLIDINYFPGYEKMPNYEQYMVQFLRSFCFRDQAQQHEAAGQRQAAGQAAQQAQQQQAQLAPEPAAAGPAQRQHQLEQ